VRVACLLGLLVAGCESEPEPADATPPATERPVPAGDIEGGPEPMPTSGTAPLAVSLPAGLFTSAEVQCAGGFTEQGIPEDAGANELLMVHGLPEGESCALFLKGEMVSRHAPVTAGQRWACKFRKAEARCKLLGGPPEPTVPTPEDWPWDKVGTEPVSKAEAKAFDDARDAAEEPQ